MDDIFDYTDAEQTLVRLAVAYEQGARAGVPETVGWLSTMRLVETKDLSDILMEHDLSNVFPGDAGRTIDAYHQSLTDYQSDAFEDILEESQAPLDLYALIIANHSLVQRYSTMEKSAETLHNIQQASTVVVNAAELLMHMGDVHPIYVSGMFSALKDVATIYGDDHREQYENQMKSLGYDDLPKPDFVSPLERLFQTQREFPDAYEVK